VIGAGKIDRRNVIWGLSLMLVASNLLAAISSNIWELIAARVVLGIALGGVWSLAAALVLRLVPARLLSRAMMIIFTGVSAATVCAPALGSYLGHLWGWRATFLAAAGIGILALIFQLLSLPRLPPAMAPSFSAFSVLLRYVYHLWTLCRFHLHTTVSRTRAATGYQNDFTGIVGFRHRGIFR
jgi:DHA1 family purine ribonucleoside efflux pump-like MFS transporter